MIRKAELQDVEWIVKRGVYDMCSLLGNTELYNPKYLIDVFVPYIIQNGIAFVDQEQQGIIGGIISPHIFNPEKKVLMELMWWVDESKRGSSIGYRLLKSFEEAGISSGVDYIQMSLMETSVVHSLEKQGYHRKEFALVKEI